MVDSVRVSPPAKASIAGSRDCTTTLPAPSKATAIGCPTVGGTDGSGTPQVGGGAVPPLPAAPVLVLVPGGIGAGVIVPVPLEPAVPVPAPGSSLAERDAAHESWLQGPCMPSGLQPT